MATQLPARACLSLPITIRANLSSKTPETIKQSQKKKEEEKEKETKKSLFNHAKHQVVWLGQQRR